ncbi:MAG: SpoIID/LytB domain-containing protein [Bacteroidaceae bacterium]|nr:SpoIID/LytB domain-containing protein [Bacteroidaceae bacterium]
MDRALCSVIRVGVMTAPAITVTLHGKWRGSDGSAISDRQIVANEPAEFAPLGPDSSFTLHGVTIGKSYHWERKEDQTFIGKLTIIRDGEQLTAVNILPIEDYLVSVISSEMSATASLEFLKAAAVISRSWVMGKIRRPSPALPIGRELKSSPYRGIRGGHLITWQDHEDHTLYDVCADDHCQRYQGITKASNPNVRRAVEETRGEVLTYDGEICDCRFSKCCGGRMEEFATCWQDKDVPYLQALEDRDPRDGTILCDTHDKAILAQVLNDYDQETIDFYRWTVTYTQDELSDLLRRKLGRDFGQVLELRPIKRGKSGRICQLLIRGTKDSMTIGKELTIRSALSESHLYSSAFEVEQDGDTFTLHGKGWGHGVGLCQIGAAVMGSKGYNYREILAHYYPNTRIEKR